MSSRAAKATLAGAIVLSTLTIWAVHFQQEQQHEVLQTMYKGVIRDDERRKEKMRQREADLQESKRKRELYERVQPIEKTEPSS
ncbi:hypothetical protein B0H10DRAFT_1127779 [Mycena sp. CBHHK59/15]|nr:hypothetical protein B0H10DRAFT_1127779 [Mycena sp. CBHHK59/15]